MAGYATHSNNRNTHDVVDTNTTANDARTATHAHTTNTKHYLRT